MLRQLVLGVVLVEQLSRATTLRVLAALAVAAVMLPSILL
jgi:hypothetical protein